MCRITWISPALISIGAAAILSTIVVAAASACAMIYGPLLLAALRVIRSKGKMPPLPPGSVGIPFWGESLDYLKSWNNQHNPDVWYDRRRAKYGDIFATHVLGSPTVVMLGANANRFILSNQGKLFRNASFKSLSDLIGKHALFTSQGSDHRRMRRIIHSVLGQEALKKAVGTFEELVLLSLNSGWHVGQIIHAHPQIKEMALRVAAEIFMGLKPGKELETFGKHFHDYSAGLLSHPLDLPWTVFGKAKRARASMLSQIRAQIQLHRTASMGKSGDSEHGNFLDMVLSAQKDGSDLILNDEEIADNLMGLFTGGQDTTSSALATILKHLALSPHVLQRLSKDCEKLRDSKKAGEPLTWSDIKSVDYLHNVISEGLRIVAPVNGGFKQNIIDVVYGGYTIPKGWKVHYSTRQTNNKEEYFPNPKKFDPDRFIERQQAFSFVPFGYGSRMCPGNEFARLEMEVFLYHFVLRYDWDLMDADERTDMMRLSPQPMHGLPLILKLLPTPHEQPQNVS